MTANIKWNQRGEDSEKDSYSKGSLDPSKLFPYNPPEWVVKRLTTIPKFRVKLIQPFTPIYKWNLPGVPTGFDVSIKRDDMTGITLSGNKARKLEFLLGDAIHKKCNAVITVGDVQSNHCRTTAVAARQVGLEPHLLIRSSSENPEQIPSEGNMFIDMLVGSSLYLVPLKPFQNEQRMEKLAECLRKSRNLKCYTVKPGGSNAIGLYGYIEAWNELMQQGILERFDDLAVAVGSGGTATGLAVANYLTGSHLKVHAFVIRNDKVHVINHVTEILEEIGLDLEVKAEELIDVVEGSIGLGYAKSTPEELEFITNVSMKTGVILDPTYTGKVAFGLVEHINTNPSAFKGKRILFVHTGGFFGCVNGKFKSVLGETAVNRIQGWMDMDVEPVVL
ncbi:bifunctional D-cysteine desulfhydrase/1-aminocyclopropane-1-carboxylate deaminase, mitochondrial-like [Anneissia japonica]|uniref:bifunctional D-cysteine desulfhydrase/1-aminocyclopropane-1-carboxylate deaminase, mitochondrial-like n=1 Tax=Anneissia japonica TaxID=1529436 RepID=UPI0014256C22|nr:bifunctional D-cysteine desulfhydrase/1-aminocyclopropane-1-carboxylate deaminase, mitochondrial-like [Anneissia japonica]XP_033111317.1 bifunctional D-cysteine desulfhydrase/1-aminocyclopropane-1-carboxylate deaminase, mitochondrial-like [Anneissia japonica]XP_033111324.1 bifunctional D-cysteine desulfhydrase/1-aminocyclopropane-1-carboxylate deaminase, mitochondrial-like [Anneissia japonica]